MKTFIVIIIVIILVLITKRAVFVNQWKNEVEKLYSYSEDLSSKIFTSDQLKDLPLVVQGYFKHVLTEGQHYISKVYLTHNGKFKSGKHKKWSRIKGRQYFSAWKPGFIWKGQIAGFVSATDKFINGTGGLTIKIFDFITIGKSKGKHIDQGELLRWLGESFWFPTNLIPSEHLSWEPIDDQTAKLIFNYYELNLNYIVKFNEKHEIVRLETERYMNEKSLKPWFGECSNYREVDGIKVPFNIKATWKLEDGDFNYVDFNITEIKFDT